MDNTTFDAELVDVKVRQAQSGVFYMTGKIFKDRQKRWTDGTTITTSAIPGFTVASAPITVGQVVQTKNTRYRIVSLRR